MKRILFIAPHSYPIRSSESICNSKIAFSLAKAGYKVDVFSCSDDSTYPSDVQIDRILRNSKNLTIISVKGRSMSRFMDKWQLFKLIIHHLIILCRTGYYYNGIDYPYQIVRAIRKRIKDEGRMPYDVVITRGFHTDYAGIYMAKKYGLKWISNWNDPFPNLKFPPPYGKGVDAKLPFYEQTIINDIQKYSTIFTFPCERLRDYMLKCFSKVKIEDTIVIHHMAHSILSQRHTYEDNSIIRFIHSGSVSKPRDPRNFLKALASVAKHSKIQIECIFLGGYDKEIESYVNELDLTGVVQFLPSMAYSESLEYLKTADLSLVIEAICDEGIYLPTKFVDALQTGIPVFCVSPANGTLNDYCKKYEVGYSCDNTNIDDIKNTLKQVINDKINNRIPRITIDRVNDFFEDFIVNQYKSIL